MSIDPEKIPDGPRSMTCAGILIESRYGKKRELEDMIAALITIARFEPHILCAVRRIFCDSKGCACYTVTCNIPEYVEDVASAFDAEFRAAGGHNSIYVEVDTGDPSDRRSASRDAWWAGDDDDD
jgi:hypothetical protein